MPVEGIVLDDFQAASVRHKGAPRGHRGNVARDRSDVGRWRDRDGRWRDRDEGGRRRDWDESGRCRDKDSRGAVGGRGRDRDDGGRRQDRDDEARGREDHGKARDPDEENIHNHTGKEREDEARVWEDMGNGRDPEGARGDSGKGKGRQRDDARSTDGERQFSRRRELVQDPIELGLRWYLTSLESPPDVPEEKRYAVRDETAKHVLREVGCTEEDLNNFVSYEDSANTRLGELQTAGANMKTKLSEILQKQFQHVTLFQGESHNEQQSLPKQPSQERTCHHVGARDDDANEAVNPVQPDALRRASMNLLGQFDCVAVPACADFDPFFDPIPRGRAEAREVDASGVECFQGWFWCVHAAAPNIGEDEKAAEFSNYCLQKQKFTNESNNSPNNSPALERQNSRPVLDEKAYLADFRRIWQNIILSMGQLEVDDAILFPIGMGAFLRRLSVNDSIYNDRHVMKLLRRRIADQLMDVICSLFPGIDKESIEQKEEDQKRLERSLKEWDAHQKSIQQATIAQSRGERVVVPRAKPKPKPKPSTQPKSTVKLPHRIHLCLVVANQESIENHNAFVEATSDKISQSPGLKDLVCIHRNADVMDLARNLGIDKSPLKVAILNGANRNLFGNHWFQSGAKFAIDENLHRRSTSLSCVSLLLNMSTEPSERRRDELAQRIRSVGGRTVSLDLHPAQPLALTGHNRSVFSLLCGCCRPGSRDERDRGRPKAATAQTKNSRGASGPASCSPSPASDRGVR